jgi:hypothetical protein
MQATQALAAEFLYNNKAREYGELAIQPKVARDLCGR